LPRHTNGKDKVAILEVIWDLEGLFISRPNRFTAKVDINGSEETVHVHDPGRLEELLYPGNRVLVKTADNPKRKTKWDLIATNYKGRWVFTNSGYHRKISERLVGLVFPGWDVRAEVQVGHSRLDFVIKKEDRVMGVEVKGCTLTENGVALFPDAPTSRGRKHIETLVRMMEDGMEAALMVLVFRKDSMCFAPNRKTDPKFADAFEKAVKMGLDVRPLLLEYDGRTIWWTGEIELCERL
jgi:sugar fermentation stimulation protein A